TYGYRFVKRELEKEGWRVNLKKVQRLRRAEGLVAVQPKRKRRPRGLSTAPRVIEAQKRNDVWTWDFIFDRAEDGRTIKIFSLVDEYSRYCIALGAEDKINGPKVRGYLQQACHKFGYPKYIRSDNGAEFIAKEVRKWVGKHSVKTHYIDPGSPWQNPFVE